MGRVYTVQAGGCISRNGLPFRLRTPVLVRWDLNFTKGIALRPCLRGLE